jgi:rod shape-determining protein MreD
MSLGVGIPLTLLAAMLQASLVAELRGVGAQPDLVVLIVVAWALLNREREGLFWAFAGGLALDLFSGAPLGISSLALLPVAFVAGLSEQQVFRHNVVLPLAIMAAGGLVYHALYLGLLRLSMGYPVNWSESLLYVTLPSLFLDVVLIIPFFRLLGPLHDRLHPRQVTI